MSELQNELTIRDIESMEGIIYEKSISHDDPLTKWYSVVRMKCISQLNEGDLARFIRQALFLKYIVPEALRRLRKEPTLGELYYGEVLAAICMINIDFWYSNKLILKEVRNLLNLLNGKNQTIKDFEWLYEGEELEFYDKIKLFREKLDLIQE
jgi:hypothetical protein